MKTGIFPGTFDPITRGHSDLVARAGQLFEKVIIAVAESPGKKPVLSQNVRVQLAIEATKHLKHVEVIGFNGLLIDFARAQKAHAIIRSLRSTADFEHESQLAYMNQALDPNIQTIFLTPSAQFAFISSSLVREVASLGGDVSSFVHESAVTALKKLWH